MPTATISKEYRDLRIRLMQEELDELIVGMQRKDLYNIAKELADLVYVVFGTISAYGMLDRFPEIFDEVHRSNMSKTHIPGRGKPQKLGGYRSACIGDILD